MGCLGGTHRNSMCSYSDTHRHPMLSTSYTVPNGILDSQPECKAGPSPAALPIHVQSEAPVRGLWYKSVPGRSTAMSHLVVAAQHSDGHGIVSLMTVSCPMGMSARVDSVDVAHRDQGREPEHFT